MRRIVAVPLLSLLACSASPPDVNDVTGAIIGSPADPNPMIAFTQNALAVGLDRTNEPASASSCSLGSGTLQPYGVWFADFDGDGRLDVYNVNHGQACHLSGLWLGNGTGFGKNIYSVATTLAPTNGNYGLTNEVAFVGDLTGDGRPDLYFTSWSGLGGMCVNQGNAAHGDWTGPSFVCYTATMAAAGATSHAVLNFGDVNGDGKIDIETVDPTVTYNLYKVYCRTMPTVWLLNNGNPDPSTWTRVSNYQQFAGQSTGVFLDFNGDGRPDKIQGVEVSSSSRGPYGGNSGGLRISLGQPDGTYTQLSSTGLESVKQPIVRIEDINEDGCLDIGVDQTGYRDNQTWYVQNKSGGGACLLTFTSKARTALPYYPGFRRYTADFDNDGLLDHAVIVHIGYGSNDGQAGGIHIMRKLTTGAYQDLGAAGTNLNGTDSSEFYADNLTIGDWNNDGKIDIGGQGSSVPSADHGAGLWTSTLSTTNRWLKIQLPEVSGFFTGAATIEIYDAGSLGDSTHYVTPPRTLRTGNAWASQIYDFGVGTRQTVDLRVTFPGGVQTTQIAVATNSSIVVHPLANVPPTASASASPPTAKVGHAISFSGAGSTDPDGSIGSYTWAFGDGSSASGISASHAYASPGSFTATLTVTDNSGGTGSAQVAVNVVANLPPAPVAAASPTTAAVGESIGFSSSGSSDADGLLTAFAWSFGDGATATGAAVSHAYAAPGSYIVTLTVTDDDGATAVATVGVTVIDVVAPTMSITSVVVVVTANTSDDVAVRGVNWTLDGAPQTGTTAAPFSFSFDFNALTSGTHTITGVATDTSGNVSQTTTLQIAR